MICFGLYIIIVILNLIMVLSKRNSVIVGVISVVFIVLATAGSVDNADYHNYYLWYNGGWHPKTVDIGYMFLSDTFSGLDLPYWFFLASIQCFCLGIYIFVISKYGKGYHVFLLMYLIYQIFLDYVQIRNTIAISLVVLALYFLSKNNRLVTLLILILSATIHKSMILMIPIVFIYSKNKSFEKIIKMYFYMIIVFCGLIFLNGNQLPFLSLISKLPFLAHKFEKYFSTKTRFGFVIPFALQFINIIIVSCFVFIQKSLDHYKFDLIHDYSNKQNRESENNFVKICYAFVMFSCFAFPLLMIHEEFIRYFRNCNIIVYLLVSIVYTNHDTTPIFNLPFFQFPFKLRMDRISVILVLILCNILWLIMYSPNHVITTFFTNNQWLSGYC